MEENITKRAPTQYNAAYIWGGRNSVQSVNLPHPGNYESQQRKTNKPLNLKLPSVLHNLKEYK